MKCSLVYNGIFDPKAQVAKTLFLFIEEKNPSTISVKYATLPIFLRIAKISPIFKGADVLPWRLPDFDKQTVLLFNNLAVIVRKTRLDKI